MAKWTNSAKAEWKTYGIRLREALKGSEADVAEVEEDLKRHVDEEAHAYGLTIIDGDWLRQTLGRIGNLEVPENTPQTALPSQESMAKNAKPANIKGSLPFGLLLTAVVWPSASVVIELMSRFCTGVLFDPMPSMWHVAMLVFVPIGNLLALVWMHQKEESIPRWVPFVISFKLGVSFVYSMMFLPITPIGVVAIIYFGFGLLGLTPLAAWISGMVLWKRFRLEMQRRSLKVVSVWPGFFMALGLLFVLETPELITRIGLRWADSTEASTRDRGVRWLRFIGQEDTLLRACYERPRRIFDLSGWLVQSNDQVTQEDARRVYYQVTGRPFNSVQPPNLYTRDGRWDVLDQEFTWEFDAALGGTAVAGRVSGLEMTASRLDTRIETSSACAYTEWTMEFKNDSRRAREARAQVLLPPGGVVSRLTLWVNGEEREAAFGSRSQTRAAYQTVAVERRRDPVLVTTSGPDQILVQCFPVPANGGTMKIRFGITAPMNMSDLTHGRFRLPALLERNFNLQDKLKHGVWIESRSQLSGAEHLFKHSMLKEGDHALHGELVDRDLIHPDATVRMERPDAVQQVWTDAMEAGHVILQELKFTPSETTDMTVIVVDGSVSMSKYAEEVRQALTDLSSMEKVWMAIASDQQSPFNINGAPRFLPLEEALQHFDDFKFRGGQDNIAYLLQAWDRALEMGADNVWWLHGPQPVLIGNSASLLQRMERTRGNIVLHAASMEPGPNRVLEALDGWHIRRVPRYESIADHLSAWIKEPGTLDPENKFRRSMEPKNSVTNLVELPRVSRHIERLWARDKMVRLRNSRKTEAATELATTHQLVTPLTGAVVLETMEQFEEMGLSPVPLETVPSIPEPGVVALWFVGMMTLMLRLRKRT